MRIQRKRLLVAVVVCAAIAVGVGLRLKALNRQALFQADNLSALAARSGGDADRWLQAVERVKEDRTAAELGGAIEIPTELRHYSDRHWFLATQVAEVKKFSVQSCQDFVDLAAMIERGELVSLPAVTDTYVLYGVGARTDDGVFSRFIDDHNVELYEENELRAAYGRLDSARTKLHTEIADLEKQLGVRKRVNRAKRSELQKEITVREQKLAANTQEKALLDRFYGQREQRQELARDFGSLQALAKNFSGRSFNLDDATDRRALKVIMLSSLRPQAVKVLEAVAQGYHDKFNRPLPVSSLIRPEQYQHALRKVNRNAVLIDTPPHSTGLAFDIDYRYMSGAEQTFVMMDLARLKTEGRIEVIRERNANYHVFVFVDGQRPSDELITASRDDAGAPPEETEPPATKTATKVERKSRKTSRQFRSIRGKRR
ncbi:MAG: DUF5715 family protein [Acidobacteriota bacterium]